MCTVYCLLLFVPQYSDVMPRESRPCYVEFLAQFNKVCVSCLNANNSFDSVILILFPILCPEPVPELVPELFLSTPSVPSTETAPVVPVFKWSRYSVACTYLCSVHARPGP
jgi:hypothetical protein